MSKYIKYKKFEPINYDMKCATIGCAGIRFWLTVCDQCGYKHCKDCSQANSPQYCITKHYPYHKMCRPANVRPYSVCNKHFWNEFPLYKILLRALLLPSSNIIMPRIQYVSANVLRKAMRQQQRTQCISAKFINTDWRSLNLITAYKLEILQCSVDILILKATYTLDQQCANSASLYILTIHRVYAEYRANYLIFEHKNNAQTYQAVIDDIIAYNITTSRNIYSYEYFYICRLLHDYVQHNPGVVRIFVI